MTKPPLETRHVSLRPLDASDTGWLHRASMDPEVLFSWRFRGATPAPEAFARTLFQGVLAQFVVDGTGSTRRPIGHVSAYNADLHGGTVFFAVTAFPPFLDTGFAIEGSLLFLNYLFSTWRLRKIYIETTEEGLDQFRSGAEILHEEGRLVEHEYFNGRYIDRLTYAMYRTEVRHFLERFAPLFSVTFEANLE
jgi:RimJ/RimL family protein N-acetyltransferase